MSYRTPTISILNVPVACLSVIEALAEVDRLYREEAPTFVAYANAHTLNLASEDPRYRTVLRKAGVVLNDGIGLDLAARMYGRRFPTNLNGSDFNTRILVLAAERGWPVFFLGARPGVAEGAARRLQEYIPDLEVVGTCSGYIRPNLDYKVAEEIRVSGAEILMVAMGNPLQELWLDEYLPQTGAHLGVGVGAFFDFASGTVARAPRWMNRVGAEWLYRLGREPRRLWRRYLLGNPVFLARVAKERLSSHRTAR